LVDTSKREERLFAFSREEPQVSYWAPPGAAGGASGPLSVLDR
jgi:hypothetical protein